MDQLYVNSPVKHFQLKYVELPTFRHFLTDAGVDLRAGEILEAGCGAGRGLKLLARAFQPRRLVGFDLLPEEVARARARNPGVEIFVGDVTAIDLPANSFDAVFAFTIFHHVPAYPQAFREVFRVLKPGGAFLVDDLNERAVELFAHFLRVDHPEAGKFSWDEFRRALLRAGFRIAGERTTLLGFGYFLAVKPGSRVPREASRRRPAPHAIDVV